MRLLVLAAACLALSGAGGAQLYEQPVRAASEDRVASLPGLEGAKLNFNHYSGYLNADQTPGAPNNSFLHYWLFESQSAPTRDPLLLWLNGGPGCSSLLGLFDQLGPFELAAGGGGAGQRLALRNHSWNEFANVLIFESPIYVGFSYTKLGEWLVQDDDTVARTNQLALRAFYAKFPHFKQNPLHLVGESYAAVYVATLGALLDADATVANFRGVAMANGFLDEAKSYLSLFLLARHFGLYGRTKWEAFGKKCCNGQPPSAESCRFEVSTSACGDQTVELIRFILNSGVNPMNVNKDCALAGNSLKLGGARACTDDAPLIAYLNQPKVRAALHVPSQLAGWRPCAPLFYERKYVGRPGGLAPQVGALCASQRNLTLLMYSGDLDLVANFLGAEWFADALKRPLVRPWTAWHVDGQVAGFVKHYAGLSFVTVKGAGHMAGQDRPGEVAALMAKWLHPRGLAAARTDVDLTLQAGRQMEWPIGRPN